MIFSNSQEVIAHLYALPKLHDKADLSYIKRVLHAAGNPQDRVKTIHVTGTNGKGSTSYYLSKLLQEAGQETGLFVSPYVFEFNERIQLNSKNISNTELVDVANQVEIAIQAIRQKDTAFALVTFEYEVAMAFIYFAQVHCDYAVIEVGIGGAHDKTNVITPEVSVITTIGLDHEQVIGPTIQDIAREKSGVIKYKRPVVLGNVPKAVLPIIMAKAHAEKATVSQLGQNFTLTGGQDLIYEDGARKVEIRPMPAVEAIDAAVAIKAFSLLHLALSPNQIKAAIEHTIVPGRYQVLQDKPLIVLDGAHNIQAIKNLLNFIHEQQQVRQGNVRILVMMMKDKDIDQVFSLFKETDKVKLTTIDYMRAAKRTDFPDWVQRKYAYYTDWHKAYREMKQASQVNDILLVTGSFYLVGNILQMEAENASSRRKR